MAKQTTNQRNDSRCTVAIIGAGASGVIAAIHLLRSSFAPNIILLEPSGNLGEGIAYSTRFESHLLNVPAGNMSSLWDDPDHFVRWLRSNVARQLGRQSFARRSLYGAYLRETLAETLWQDHAARLDHYRSIATHIEADGYEARIWMENGLRIRADKVILALGHQAQHNPLPTQSDVRAVSAWSLDSFDALDPYESVLLVGSALTAVDTALALEEIGHRGTIHVVSRHGRWPLEHGTSRISPLMTRPTSITARSILRAIRAEVVSTGEWRAVVDSLRPHTSTLWSNASHAERRRFLRHLNSYWQIHRHRMPKEVARKIDAMRWSGRLLLHSGRIVDATKQSSSRVRVTVALRGGRDDALLEVSKIINCTGPSNDLLSSSNPLLTDLFASGFAQTDALQLGLLTDENGTLIGRDGLPSDLIYAIGPLRRGTLLETTAIPEIPEQAAILARRLLADPSRSSMGQEVSQSNHVLAAAGE